jgi:hypothetical protein
MKFEAPKSPENEIIKISSAEHDILLGGTKEAREELMKKLGLKFGKVNEEAEVEIDGQLERMLIDREYFGTLVVGKKDKAA